jgi:hypothetical protein
VLPGGYLDARQSGFKPMAHLAVEAGAVDLRMTTVRSVRRSSFLASTRMTTLLLVPRSPWIAREAAFAHERILDLRAFGCLCLYLGG